MSDRAPQPGFDGPTRRSFLKSSTVAVGGALAGSMGYARSVHAAGSDTLKVGLVGCGGRGTGAASDALGADPNCKLTAVADTFADNLQTSLANLKQKFSPDRIDVPQDRQFVGFDGYQKLLATDVDVVLLCTPPHFRPAQLRAAIEANKHVFCEKPVAVDAPGIRSVLATADEAKRRNLSIVSGLCYRYDQMKNEVMKQVHDGAIGDITAMHVTYNTVPLKHHGRDPQWSEMEFQVRNWNYFVWLSGDFNVEQHVHSLDKAAWAMHDEPPVKATGMGGRQVRSEEQGGNVYDHFSVVYEYANGVRLFSFCRQMVGCSGDVTDYLIGTKGTAELMGAKPSIKGEHPWRYKGPKPLSMYHLEHKALFAGIRSGNPVNNGLYMSRSTMMGIMGRMAAYTGQTLSWDQCLSSKDDLTPPKYEWGPAATAPVAKPGITQFA